jgi:hypothetical protein
MIIWPIEPITDNIKLPSHRGLLIRGEYEQIGQFTSMLISRPQLDLPLFHVTARAVVLLLILLVQTTIATWE